IIALDDLSLGTPTNLSRNVEFVQGSVMDYDLVLELTKGCEYVFHQAAKSSSPMFKPDPREGVNVNVGGFMNVMESAKRNAVKKVIFASSSSIYNGLTTPFKESQQVIPRSFYETSFYCREVVARSYFLENDVSSIGLRYFSVYGPNELHKKIFANNISQFLWDISKGKRPVIYGDGSQTRDFTYVEDVIQANILAMRSDKQFGLYNIGTGTETSFNDVLGIINRALGTSIDAIYQTNPIKNYVYRTLADISLARKELGYKPKWDVPEGVKSLIELSMDDHSKGSGTKLISSIDG
ncbi:MAG: NAD-dependent epimerase/dehydratase family protein, partial [Nitrososphaera sp.]